MNEVVISSTGLFTPPYSISNEELVASYNGYVIKHNQQYAEQINSGEVTPLRESNEAFIEKASGIKSRYVMNKQGILDINTMQAVLPARQDEELSLQAEMAVSAAQQALDRISLAADKVDLIIVACSNMQRAYPAIAIEVQAALGAKGMAFDMNVACSSATFGLQAAYALLRSGVVKTALVISPEICTAHLNFRDRDSHFIFGDACSAVVVQSATVAPQNNCFEIVATQGVTNFSNNIRNNFGFLTKTDPEVIEDPAKIFSKQNFFQQNGRNVFKEIVPAVSSFLAEFLQANQLKADSIKRVWLHQANANINRLVGEKLFGYTPDRLVAPTILEKYANTSSPGCVIAFHHYRDDFVAGDWGILCSFGAGYSIGGILLRKV